MKDFKVHNQIEVSKSKLLWNFDYLGKISNKVVLPVLKSNAYGHGIEEVTEILKERELPYIVVNNYQEALRVKAVSSQPVLIIGAIDPANAKLLDYKSFAYAVQDMAFVRALAKTGHELKIHIDIDTGMKRYGFDTDKLPELLEKLKESPNLIVEGICTHLADGDTPDSEFTHQQAKLFDESVELIKKSGHQPKWIHISNTPGMLKVKSKYANSLRAGIGIYGVNPLESSDEGYEKLAKLKPVLELKSTITFVRDLKPGESVSYNRTWRAQKPTTIGVLTVGYYEGIPRSLSSKGVATKDGKEFTIVGRVCMNHLMIDITGSSLKVGDQVTVISTDPQSQNSIYQMSNDYYFFSYGLLAKLSSDIRRVIVG